MDKLPITQSRDGRGQVVDKACSHSCIWDLNLNHSYEELRVGQLPEGLMGLIKMV